MLWQTYFASFLCKTETMCYSDSKSPQFCKIIIKYNIICKIQITHSLPHYDSYAWYTDEMTLTTGEMTLTTGEINYGKKKR